MQEQRSVLQEGIDRFGDAPKLHMMLAQLEERAGALPAARRALQRGLKHSPQCVPLWIMLARLEERQGSVTSARAMLEQARLRNPHNADLWCAAVRTEKRAGNAAAAASTLTRALQECADTPGVGKLWALHVIMAERTQRRAKMEDALRKAGDSPHMFAAVGQKFLEDRKYDKARKYFQRATVLDSDIGDFWGLWLACEEAAGVKEAAAQVMAAAKKVSLLCHGHGGYLACLAEHVTRQCYVGHGESSLFYVWFCAQYCPPAYTNAVHTEAHTMCRRTHIMGSDGRSCARTPRMRSSVLRR